MANKRPKLESGVTPVGLARYPRLTTPDTKFKPEGEYKITLILSAEASEPLIKRIDTAMAASLATAKADPANKVKRDVKMSDPPYKTVLNDDEKETGDISFNFKMRASGERPDKSKWSAKPQLFDSKRKPLGPVNVGGGSEVRVAFEIMPFYTKLAGAGVSLRLQAVQIIKLVEYGAKDASAYGFGEEAEGYSADDESAAEGGVPDRTDEEEAALGADGERDF